MGSSTKIQWTDASWNPVRGCTRVSEGCRNCYAEAVASRFSGPGKPYHEVATPRGWNGRVSVVEGHLYDPLRWQKPKRIFVNSMSDLFHEALPVEAIDRVFAVMALAPHHKFQVLTKRPERMADYMDLRSRHGRPLSETTEARVGKIAMQIARERGEDVDEANWDLFWGWPLQNVWLGTSVEDQRSYDARIDHLARTYARVRFLSVEPLLEPVDLSSVLNLVRATRDAELPVPLHWVIVGGESGPGARPCEVRWIHGVVQRCLAAGVPVFVKQLGARSLVRRLDEFGDEQLRAWDSENGSGPIPTGGVFQRFDDRKGGDWNEWPEDLRVREYPA